MTRKARTVAPWALGAFLMAPWGMGGAQEPSPPAPARGDEALGAEEEKAVAAAMDLLAHTEAERRGQAVQTLLAFAPRIPQRLSQALEHPDPMGRLSAVRIFRASPQPQALSGTVRLLRDAHEQVREEAVLLLRDLAPPDLAGHLVVVLQRETSPRVLRQAMMGLAHTRDTSAVPHIITLMRRSADPYVVDRAAVALRSLTGQRFGEDAEAWQRWWDSRRHRDR